MASSGQPPESPGPPPKSPETSPEESVEEGSAVHHPPTGSSGEMKQICIDKATDWIENHHELRAQTEHLVKEFLADDAL